MPDNCTALTPSGLQDGGKKCNDANGCSWDVLDKRCETYGCGNITSKTECTQGYRKCAWNSAGHCSDPAGPKPICNRTLVGFLNLSNVDWGRSSRHSMSKVDYWHGNTLGKTYGYWYSTWAEGQCRPNDPTQAFCSWRVVPEPVRKIDKSCSDAAINTVIMEGDANATWGARCFSGCSGADRRNTSSTCYIECFYNNILGPLGSSQLMNHSSPGFGIPLVELQAAWEKPFLPIGQGGCPNLPIGLN